MSSIRNAGDTVYDTGSRTLASESQSTPFSVDGNPGKVSLSDLRGTRAVVNLSKVALPVDQLSSATSCGPLTLSSVFQELSIQFTTEARRNHDTYEITMKYPDRRASTNDGLNQPVGDFSAEGSICF
ncbi:MAG: hypothetical protein S4CHLAM6_08320 [Chlamydiae bacterium]|nr:hypothetical protein [Chlamydiota bacterium]